MLLSGTEEALRRQALHEIRNRIGGDPFDVQVYVGGEASPAEWLSSAATVPFLSEKRTVIVRNLLRLGPPDEALSDPKAALTSIPESGRLILVADEENVSDYTRQQRLDSYRKSWEKEVAKAGGLVLTFQTEGAAVKKTLLTRAEALGKRMSPTTADVLLEMTGKSLSRALEELEKVALFIGEEETIREADVETTAMPSREYSVFKLADSILEGNSAQALSQLRVLVGSGVKADGAAMQSIFPNLSRNLRLVWQARIFVEAKANPARPPAEVEALLPDPAAWAKVSDWQRNRAMATARKLGFAQLAACMEAVAETDARLKGLEAGFSAVDTLERMVLEMVASVKGTSVAR